MLNFGESWWVPPFADRIFNDDTELDDIDNFLDYLKAVLDSQFPPESEDGSPTTPADLMRELIRSARYLLEDKNNMPSIAIFFFMLGAIAQGLPVKRAEKFKGIEGLELFNAYRRELRKLAQMLAELRWKDGSDLRVTEMAEAVWVDIIEFLAHRKELGDTFTDEMFKTGPNDAKGLIPWIREVAPESARRPGRPPKKT